MATVPVGPPELLLLPGTTARRAARRRPGREPAYETDANPSRYRGIAPTSSVH